VPLLGNRKRAEVRLSVGVFVGTKQVGGLLWKACFGFFETGKYCRVCCFMYTFGHFRASWGEARRIIVICDSEQASAVENFEIGGAFFFFFKNDAVYSSLVRHFKYF